MNLLTLLIEKKLIAKSDAAALEKEAKATGESVEALLEKRGVEAADILAVKGSYLQVPTRSLGEESIPFDILKNIPEESALHYRFAPLSITDGVLEVGAVNPDNTEALDALNFISARIGVPFKVFLISELDFEKILKMYKGLSGEVSKAISELDTTAIVVEAPTAEEVAAEKGEGPGERITEAAPVTKIVATILRYAAEGNASDIHIEAMTNQVRVRFRVDGLLYTSLLLPNKVHDSVVARIKILSSMRLDEKRKPQDGRFSATVEGRRIDFRVSTFPAYYGEKVVMRILDTSKGFISLDAVGLNERNLPTIRELLKRPYGLVLISGPTGSGKSTTLYGMLNELDREQFNVLSLEDPVEYNIEGISQSQVRPEIGYTFATGLRTTLRQDPDIIMVGEIRDKETAQLAVQAALTGHLVLSTIHTNNAIGAIPRLIDMGVDPYLIAPTLILAIAQRLVRTLCPGGGEEVPIDGGIRNMINREFADLPEEIRNTLPKSEKVYRSKPTPECPKGSRGRTAVFEVLTMTQDLETAILKNASESELWGIARRHGMLTMKEDAILKAYERIIPIEEVSTLGGVLDE
ncbi:MAG TPA: GspE/PulE family protein [Candidatus Paceibacterota bacterium]